MDEQSSPSGAIDPEQLRQVISRLQEIRRRHLSGASEGDHFIRIQEQFENIITTLEAWQPPFQGHADPLDIAVQLKVLQRLCSEAGIPNVAQVLGSVESAVNALGQSKGQAPAHAPQRFVPPPPQDRNSAHDDDFTTTPATRGAPSSQSRRSSLPVILVMLIGLAVCVWFGYQYLETTRAQQALANLPTPTPPPPTNTAVPTPKRTPTPSGEAELEKVSKELDLAQKGLDEPDLDSALHHFATAAATDRHHRRVKDMSQPLIEALLKDAEALTDKGRWDAAANRVNDARKIAVYLFVDTASIENTAKWHATKAHFEDIGTNNLTKLKAAVGHRVRINRKSRETLFGILATVKKDTLIVDVNSGVGGGLVQFVSEVEFSQIATIRVYEDGKPITREVIPTATPTRRAQPKFRPKAWPTPHRRRRG